MRNSNLWKFRVSLRNASRPPFGCRAFFHALVLSISVSACTGIVRDPVDISDLNDPQPPGMGQVRYWGDEPPENIDTLVEEIFAQRRASGLISNANVLVLSGGGENGAFSAGILNAWSQSGTRPEFVTVTGVSTGALAAPFAFLGSDYDNELRVVYGGLPPESLFDLRGVFGIFSNASAASSEPLAEIIDMVVDDKFLAEIAREHRKGRRLYVQSSSLDAQRPVIWDMGKIAASGSPDAQRLFRDALLASAAIPGVFPPVLLRVQTPNGAKDEMHVDGGVISQSAFLPAWQLKFQKYAPEGLRSTTIYSIRNGKVDPEPEILDPKLTTIAGRSLSSMIKSQGNADLIIGYDLAQRMGARFRVTWIGPDFVTKPTEPFDPKYMQSLYQYGYQKFQSGNLWESAPPELLNN